MNLGTRSVNGFQGRGNRLSARHEAAQTGWIPPTCWRCSLAAAGQLAVSGKIFSPTEGWRCLIGRGNIHRSL